MGLHSRAIIPNTHSIHSSLPPDIILDRARPCRLAIGRQSSLHTLNNLNNHITVHLSHLNRPSTASSQVMRLLGWSSSRDTPHNTRLNHSSNRLLGLAHKGSLSNPSRVILHLDRANLSNLHIPRRSTITLQRLYRLRLGRSSQSLPQRHLRLHHPHPLAQAVESLEGDS